MNGCILYAAIFFPRIMLFLAWYAEIIQKNSTPFFLDVVCFFICPRFLIAYWTYEWGVHPLLTIVFVVAGLIEAVGGSSRAAGGVVRSNRYSEK